MAIADEHKWRYIFHFTDIHNLDSIIKNGLLCTNDKNEKGIKHKNIANMTIQERRADVKAVTGVWGLEILGRKKSFKEAIMKMKQS